MKVFRFALAAVLTLLAFFAPAQTTRRREVTREAPPPADAVSVDSIVAALYASVSYPAGGSPDFERMRGIFLYVGMLVPPVKPGQEIMGTDIDGFSSRFQRGAAARKEKAEGPTGFFEKEIARRADCFGNVCQIFSTYESRHTASDDKPFERGINSIQLVRDGKRWWIASVAWDAEKPDLPIPPPYQPAAK
ncbi:MAG TPA: hypothetical protein VKH43_08685 [Thermoanaerobaculia bacterium]|nr:hypothetical protein [Thermoanaerobaculia bacterium]